MEKTMKTLMILIGCLAPTFAQGLGADPVTTKMVETGASGGFFVLALYWMRQDAKAYNDRIFEMAKESLTRLERAYTGKQHED